MPGESRLRFFIAHGVCVCYRSCGAGFGLQAAREGHQGEVEQLRAEKEALILELRAVNDRLETEGYIVKGQSQQSNELVERNAQLQERTEELREILTMKDEVIAKLRRTIDDQSLLIQSLRVILTQHR